ncbi:hypothetical protein F4678DRAFT_424074 [Xylaria arbuscula]|nr:hypothetical protein F4678DRAFT_424074 [Xylaria arbuscula]
MLLRWLPPGTVTARSRPAARLSQQIHGKARCLYRGAELRHEYPNHEKQPHLSRKYSNYAPRGQPPYYDVYAQAPRSRASRFKDMAIGSGLTIIAYLVFDSYDYWQARKQAKEEEKGVSELKEITARYDKLMEAADDGSEESVEKINALFRERTMALARALVPDKFRLTGEFVTDLGPLPRLTEDYHCRCREAHSIEDGRTLMLMPPQPPPARLKVLEENKRTEWPTIITNSVILGVNMSARQLESSNPESKFHELICRSKFKLGKLRKEGVIYGATLVFVHLRDTMFTFICEGERVSLIGDHPVFIGHF